MGNEIYPPPHLSYRPFLKKFHPPFPEIFCALFLDNFRLISLNGWFFTNYIQQYTGMLYRIQIHYYIWEIQSGAGENFSFFTSDIEKKYHPFSLCGIPPICHPPPFLKKILNPPLLRFLKIAYPVFGRGNSDCGREGLAAIRKNVL